MEPTPEITILIGHRKALTVEMAAARAGVSPETLSVALSRGYKLPDGEHVHIQHDAMLDGKKKLYLQVKFDRWWKLRPGKGWAAKNRAGGA